MCLQAPWQGPPPHHHRHQHHHLPNDKNDDKAALPLRMCGSHLPLPLFPHTPHHPELTTSWASSSSSSPITPPTPQTKTMVVKPREDATLQHALTLFREAFGSEPDIAAYAPGRVNLIGKVVALGLSA